MIGGRLFRGYKKKIKRERERTFRSPKKNKSSFFCGKLIESVAHLKVKGATTGLRL